MNTEIHQSDSQKQSGSCCCSGKSSAQKSHMLIEDENEPVQKIAIQGASCGGCVSKIEQALLAVTNVKEASMNLAEGIAKVTGPAPMSEIISALKEAGFQAEALDI